MSIQIEALFTSALGLQAPWAVAEVKLDTAKHRIDFDVVCKAATLSCPSCGAAAQPVHDRLSRSWRHLDFFQFEAWLLRISANVTGDFGNVTGLKPVLGCAGEIVGMGVV